MTTVRKTIFQMWGDLQGLVITNAGSKSFILNFKSQDEARRAYEGGPWRIEGHMLSLQWWSPNLSINEINYNQLPIWIQIHGLPYDKINKSNAEKIGAILGRVITAKDPFVEGNMLRPFLRCGMIGHDRRTCVEEMAMSIVNPSIPKYGPELTTPGLKSIDVEARKARIRRQKEDQNNWMEELWEARERSQQERKNLKQNKGADLDELMGDKNTAVLELGDGTQTERRIEEFSSGSRDRPGDKSNQGTEIERPNKYIEKTIGGMKGNKHKSKEMNEEGAGPIGGENNVQPNMEDEEENSNDNQPLTIAKVSEVELARCIRDSLKLKIKREDEDAAHIMEVEEGEEGLNQNIKARKKCKAKLEEQESGMME
nr:uncharacterized protein LOC114927457 [Arachis hypogaea]